MEVREGMGGEGEGKGNVWRGEEGMGGEGEGKGNVWR